ncbi:aldo/keto reductase [Evansella halocellulosilytica]|uniref:aldo/keto reductase n=1 Tax=Evansella halocellulosilytica TaxID=2011013 RepID=UPI0015CC24E8|nr:aldo/keto reductase [Evansella halocellulosilytica]
MQNDHTSVLTLGTVQLGMEYGIGNTIGKPKRNQALNMLRYAFAKGINSFDTAPNYGSSERIIGKFISELKKQKSKQPQIMTKVPKVSLPEHSSDSEVTHLVKESLYQSMKRLNVSQIDVCFMHDPHNMTSHSNKVMNSFIKVKEEGLVKSIGVSVYTPEEVRKFLSIDCFDTIQVPVNLFDQRLIQLGLLDQLKETGVNIYARSIYLQGLLLLHVDQVPQNLSSAQPYLKKLHEMSEKSGYTVAELALLFVRDLKQIDQVVVGSETIEQLKNNVRMIEKPKLPDHLLQELSFQFQRIPENVRNPVLWNGAIEYEGK